MREERARGNAARSYAMKTVAAPYHASACTHQTGLQCVGSVFWVEEEHSALVLRYSRANHRHALVETVTEGIVEHEERALHLSPGPLSSGVAVGGQMVVARTLGAGFGLASLRRPYRNSGTFTVSRIITLHAGHHRVASSSTGSQCAHRAGTYGGLPSLRKPKAGSSGPSEIPDPGPVAAGVMGAR